MTGMRSGRASAAGLACRTRSLSGDAGAVRGGAAAVAAEVRGGAAAGAEEVRSGVAAEVAAARSDGGAAAAAHSEAEVAAV